MNSDDLFYYLNKFSKSLTYFIILFFALNVEVSLNLFSFFDYSAPSLLSIIIYVSMRKFSINFSNLILFPLGIIYDVLLGMNLGSSSMFFLLIKYFTKYIGTSFFMNNYDDDWFYFTCVFLISFLITFLVNIIFYSIFPDFSPILFHVGVTLIIFPFIIMFINFINSITNLLKK